MLKQIQTWVNKGHVSNTFREYLSSELIFKSHLFFILHIWQEPSNFSSNWDGNSFNLFKKHNAEKHSVI